MLVVEKRDVTKVYQETAGFFRKLGFTMKVEEPVYDLERVEFCQTRPVKVNGAYRMVRNVHQSLSKDLHSLNDLKSEKAVREWVHAVGSGNRCLCDGVPVMQKFFECFPASSGPNSRSDMAQMFKEQNAYKFARTGRNLGVITHEARYSFWLAFGLLPDEQIALENDFHPLSLQRVVEEVEVEPSLLGFSRA